MPGQVTIPVSMRAFLLVRTVSDILRLFIRQATKKQVLVGKIILRASPTVTACEARQKAIAAVAAFVTGMHEPTVYEILNSTQKGNKQTSRLLHALEELAGRLEVRQLARQPDGLHN